MNETLNRDNDRSSNSIDEQRELVAVDDVVIARAFRWSLIVIAAIIVLAVATAVWMSREDELELVQETAIVLPKAQTQVAIPPEVRFVDITRSAGIEFVHTNGARGKKLLPETMGGGCAFFDYDDDGDPDLLFVNATWWPGERIEATASPTMELYENDGRGRFRNATQGSGLQVSFYGTGVAIGDYDSDGDLDLFISAVGENHLFRNEGKVFRDVTSDARVGGDPSQWSSACAFMDYDNDGHLDLFVGNYIRWSQEIDLDVDYRLEGLGRAYGPPTNFEGAHPYLYRNLGDGAFEEVSEPAGLRVANPATGLPVAKTLAVAPVDFDADGSIDLFVANDTVQNFLFHNRGNGTFAEIGGERGVAYDSEGKSTGAMGIDAAHYRNDQAIAVGIGNFATEMTSLYVSDGSRGFFTDESIVEGIGPRSRQMLTFGLFFFDYDLDGCVDLLQVNGHLEENINVVQPSQHYRQPAQLFWNSGRTSGRCFVPVDPNTTGDLATPIVGRGAAYADIDGDGDLDVLFTQVAGPALLLRNDQTLGHHWLRVRLRARSGNRQGIGAWIELTAGGRTQRRQVMPTRSYLSQVEPTVTFGLGDLDEIDALRILWPRGKTQNIPAPAVDQTLRVEEAP